MVRVRPIKLIDQTPTIVDGESEPQEITLLRAWAEIRESKGNQLVQNGQTLLTKFFEFRFRYRSDVSIDSATKILCDGKRYTVHSIAKENQKPFHWIVTGEAKS